MDIRITNIEQASKAYRSNPKGIRADRIWILWDEMSIEQVRKARDKDELNKTFLSSPSGGLAEKEAIAIFLRNKRKEWFK